MTRTIAVAMLVLGLVGFTLAAFDNETSAASWKAYYIEIDGPIMPLTERFLSRAIKEADESGAALLIVELDTPGGLLKTTESMVDAILDAPIPVAVLVSPPGIQGGIGRHLHHCRRARRRHESGHQYRSGFPCRRGWSAALA